MIRKLFRYDFRIVAERLIPFYIAILVISVISRLATTIIKFRWEDLEYGDFISNFGVVFVLGQIFLVFAFIIVIAGIFLMVNFIMISRYHKSIYGNEGYLTNTLPLEPHQIIISKIFNFVSWLFISSVVVFISIFIIIPYDFGKVKLASMFTMFSFLLSEKYVAHTIIFSIIATLVSTLFDVIKLYLSVAFANLFSEYKLVMGIVGFIGISFVTMIISSTIVYSISSALLRSEVFDVRTAAYGNPFFLPTNIASFILNIIYCVIGYFTLLYLHKNKLNLE